MRRGNVIQDNIQQDAENIIESLSNYQYTHQENLATVKEFKQEKKKLNDIALKNELERLINAFDQINVNEKNLVSDMTMVKSLHSQKKKYERLNIDVPGEIMNKLVEKIVNVKTEKTKNDIKKQNIMEDYEDLRKQDIKKPLSRAGRSVLNNSSVSTVKKGGEKRGNLMRDAISTKDLKLDHLAMISASKKGGDKQFAEYLKNYEDELSKSLLVMQPGTEDYRRRFNELGKVADMRNVFQNKAQTQVLREQRGLDQGDKLRANRIEMWGNQNDERLRIKNKKTMEQVQREQDENEEIRQLRTRMARMDETLRGMEDVIREKERFSSLQRQKYEMLESERHQVELEKLRAERQREEADHLKKLQRMNMEMDYLDQMKQKTVKLMSTQLQDFDKLSKNRLKKNMDLHKEFQNNRILDIQNEFILRERKRQAEFDSYVLKLEQRYREASHSIKDLKKLGLGKPNIERDIWAELGMPPADWEEEFGKRKFESGVKKIIHEFGAPQAGLNPTSRRIVVYNSSDDDMEARADVSGFEPDTLPQHASKKKKGKKIRSKNSRASKSSVNNNVLMSPFSTQRTPKMIKSSSNFLETGNNNNKINTVAKRQSVFQPHINPLSSPKPPSRRRESELSIISNSVKDGDKDKQSFYIKIHQIKNLPENFSFVMLFIGLLDENGGYINKLGEIFVKMSSDCLNPLFKKNLKFPAAAIQQGQKGYIYSEIRVIDDSKDVFEPSIYGSFIFEFDHSTSGSFEHHLFFDNYYEQLIQDFQGDALEQHIGSSIQFSFNKGSVLKSKSYQQSPVLKYELQGTAVALLQKRKQVDIEKQMRQILLNSGLPAARNMSKKQLWKEMRNKMISGREEQPEWASLRYFLPLQQNFKWVSISLAAIVDLEEGATKRSSEFSVFVGRIFINQKTSKEVKNYFKIDWTSSKTFQYFDDEVDDELELSDVSTNNYIIMQILKVQSSPEGGFSVKNYGFSVMPAVDDAGFPIIGLHVLPVFKNPLTKDLLAQILEDGDSWTFVEEVFENKQYVKAEQLAVIKLCDQYRQVRLFSSCYSRTFQRVVGLDLSFNFLGHVYRCFEV